MRAPRPNLLKISALLVLFFSSTLLAQQESPPDQPEGAPDAEVTSKEESGDSWKNLIYIPYKNFKEAFEEKKGSVLIPYQEYLELLKKAREDVLTAQGKSLGIPAVITESQYSAQVDGDFAKINLVLKIQALKSSWNEVSLNFGNAAIGKMESSDQGEVLLRGAGQGKYKLILPDKGDYEVNLELSVKVQTSPDGRSFSFPCPAVGITTLEVSIPKADQSIEIQPQVVTIPVEAAEGTSKVKSSLGSTDRITVKWSPRTGSKPEMDLLTSVHNETHVSISDNLVHKNATLQYRILRGELSQLELVIPKEDRILDVSSSDARIRQWNIKKEENQQKITVDLISPVTGKFQIEVHTETALPKDPFSIVGVGEGGVVSGIHTVGSVRENGQIVLTHSEELAVVIEEQKGLTRIDQSKIPQELRGPNTLSFEFYNSQIALKISTSAVEPRLTTSQYLLLRIQEESIKLTSKLSYKIERAGIFELQVKIPEGVEIDSVSGGSVESHSLDDKTGILTIVFKNRSIGDYHIVLTGQMKFSEEEKFQLPIPEPLGTERETGLVQIYAPDSFELITDEKELKGVYEPPENFKGQDRTLRSQWSYNLRPVVIPVTIKRKPTRLTATEATTINVQNDLTQVSSVIKYQIENAGVHTFRIAVPESVKNEVQIIANPSSGQPAVQQKTLEEEVKDGWAIWNVRLQREVVGSYQFVVKFDLKKNKNSEEEEHIQIPRVMDLVNGEGQPTLTLSRIQGEIAIQKDRSISLVSKQKEGNAEAIDVRELKLLPQTGYQAYRYYSQPVTISINRSEHAIQEVIKTVVSKSLSEVVIGKGEQATYRCRYRIQSSERQRLNIWLPTGAEPLGVLLNNKTISLEKNEQAETEEGWTSYLVNVSRDSSSDVPFVLTVQFRLTISPAPFESAGGKLQLRFPRIESGGGESLTAATQQSRVAVWIPDQYRIVGIPDGYLPDQVIRMKSAFGIYSHSDRDTDDLDKWFGEGKKGLYDFPQIGHVYRYRKLGSSEEIIVPWWKASWFAFYISGGLFIVGLVLSKTAWENRVSILIAGCLLLTLYGLKDHVLIYHFLSAASYGLLATVAVWWVLSFLKTNRKHHANGSKKQTSEKPVDVEKSEEITESKQEEEEKSSEENQEDSPPEENHEDENRSEDQS